MSAAVTQVATAVASAMIAGIVNTLLTTIYVNTEAGFWSAWTIAWFASVIIAIIYISMAALFLRFKLFMDFDKFSRHLVCGAVAGPVSLLFMALLFVDWKLLLPWEVVLAAVTGMVATAIWYVAKEFMHLGK